MKKEGGGGGGGEKNGKDEVIKLHEKNPQLINNCSE